MNYDDIEIVTHKTIYKRTSGGKVQIWFAETQGGRYRSTSGQQDGKKTVSEWTYTEKKNVGKANETSETEQALLEVFATYDKRLARDYRNDISEIDTALFFAPMLAAKWKEIKNKIKFCQDAVNAAVQPKLDGMRCIIKADGMWSREGKPIKGAPHIFVALSHVFEANPDLILDGELYNHEYKDDFNTIISACKKQTPTEAELQISIEKIQYHIYDMPSVDDVFAVRWQKLLELRNYHYITDNTPIRFVETVFGTFTPEQVDEWAGKWLLDGYEGLMFRTNARYENKRTKSLQKWKEFVDEEYIFLAAVAGRGGRAGMAASVICLMPHFDFADFEPEMLEDPDWVEKNTFSAGMIGRVPFLIEFYNSYKKDVGKPATIQYQNLTPDGKPRFGKFKEIREWG